MRNTEEGYMNKGNSASDGRFETPDDEIFQVVSLF